MGVSGLTAFIRENRNSVLNTVHLTPLSNEELQEHQPSPLVVDSWSFIWVLYSSQLPSFPGGEYLAFHRLIKRVIEGWARLGIRPYFVFDGPAPPSKRSTIISRLEKVLQNSLLFYRTSVQSRSSPYFSKQSPILPAFLFHVLRDTLAELSVPTFYLAEGEADGYCYSLANELGGWVLSGDSDFTIFGCGSSSNDRNGYKGWVPMDSVQWMLESPQQDAGADLLEKEGFSTVKSKSSKARAITAMSSSLVPPEPIQGSTITYPSLFLKVCHPADLASRLRIPASHLPLLASIAGTDHSPPTGAQLFFEARSNGTDRIEKVGRVIREALTPTGQSKRKQRQRIATMASSSSSKTDATTDSGASTPQLPQNKNGALAGDEAYTFVSHVVAEMMSTWNPGPRAPTSRLHPEALDQLVSDIIDATCQYIPPSSPPDIECNACCDTFPYCRCSQIDDLRTDDRVTFNGLHELRRAYARTRARGHLSFFSYYLNPSSALVFGILEDPEGVSLRAANITRSLRRTGWVIFLQGVGGLPQDSIGGECEEDSESQDGLNTDFVADASIGPAVSSEAEMTSLDMSSVQSQVTDIVELLRAGSSNRMKGVPLKVTEDTYAMETPTILDEDPDKRFNRFLSIMKADSQKILALQQKWRPLVAMLRMSVLLAYEHNSPWSRKELRLSIVAGVLSSSAWSEEKSDASEPEVQSPPLESRNCNVYSHVVAIALDASQLAQALLLDADDTSPLKAMYRFLEGTIWHQVLLGHKKEDPSQASVVMACFEAAAEGMETYISLSTARAGNDTSWSSNSGRRGTNNVKSTLPSERGKIRFATRGMSGVHWYM